MTQKLNILAFGAHPDDVELCCAGTLLKHLDMGYSVGLIDLTRGELGTRGNPDLRLREARASADLLGIEVRENLGMQDGFFVNDKEHRIAIARIIRKYRPDVVIANAVRDRHPDHGRAAQLVTEGCFVAGLVKVPTRLDGQPQERWRPRAIYHYIQDYKLSPDICVDVTPYMEKRMDAIRCFSSQFYDPDSPDPDSPISGKDFLDMILAAARVYGRPIGAEFGEAFTVARPVGVEDLTDLR
ncbi:MAG: bacillithiol biosynthesis deacetylase BshB1 [Saprospiraceae bacterium]|nr:bacillithiol biosynthesis deacetylase BshB1 [Saprospiraceae bacterium]